MMTVLRVLFAGALLGVCVVIARARAGKLELRSKALGEFLGLSRQLEALIRVNGRTIPDALGECSARLGDAWTGKFAKELARLYGGRSAASGLWAAALRDAAGYSEEAAALAEDDRQIIALFGDQLASSDLKSIGENYALLYARIGEKLQESDRDRAVKGRLYRTIGTLAGLAAAIVVI
jgi:stage III sporulation protein AB